MSLCSQRHTHILRLSAVDGLNTGTDNLTKIRTGIHTERNNAREKAVKLDESEHPKRRKLNHAEHAIIDDKNLNNNRRRTQNLYIRGCQKAERIETADHRQRASLSLVSVLIKSQKTKRPEIGQPHQRQ